MKNQRFRRLEVWKRAMDFVSQVYEVTGHFPSKEQYGLTSQLRKAACSIALNIAEGSAAGSDAEFRRFLTISLRSNYEVMCGMEIARRLSYCTESELEEILGQSDEISAMLTGLKKGLRPSFARLTTED